MYVWNQNNKYKYFLYNKIRLSVSGLKLLRLNKFFFYSIVNTFDKTRREWKVGKWFLRALCINWGLKSRTGFLLCTQYTDHCATPRRNRRIGSANLKFSPVFQALIARTSLTPIVEKTGAGKRDVEMRKHGFEGWVHYYFFQRKTNSDSGEMTIWFSHRGNEFTKPRITPSAWRRCREFINVHARPCVKHFYGAGKGGTRSGLFKALELRWNPIWLNTIL